jgi:hypothetical protein
MGARCDAKGDLTRLVPYGTGRIGIACAPRIAQGRSAA